MSITLFSIISGFCGFIQFVIYLSFFIVTVTVVRTRRPDAWSPLAAGAGLLTFDFVLRYIVSIALPMATSRMGSGMESFYAGQSMVNVIGTMLSGFAWVLILIGVVRIASPPREQNLNRAPGDY
ncbi:MAG: hypothetical protein ABI183_16030 [Polyangiaceae bacterium]